MKRFSTWLKSLAFSGPFKSLKLYWSGYGGLSSLLSSVYFYGALALTFSIVKYGDPYWDWASDAKTVIACTVGFSFAGYSLMLGMAGDNFIKAIKGSYPDGKPSPLMKVASAFTHFFIIQCITLLFAIACTAFTVKYDFVARCIGIFLFIYSILVILATALTALNFVSWYNDLDPDE